MSLSRPVYNKRRTFGAKKELISVAALINYQHSKFQFDLETVDEEPLCGCANANSYLFIYYSFEVNKVL